MGRMIEEGQAPPNIYVPVQDVQTFFQSAGYTMEERAEALDKMGLDENAYQSALESETDLAIPTKAVPGLVKEPYWDVIKQRPTSFPREDYQAINEQLGRVFASKTPLDIPWEAVSRLENEMVAAGRPREQARTQAELLGRVAAVYSKWFGQTPEEYLSKFHVRSGEAGAGLQQQPFLGPLWYSKMRQVVEQKLPESGKASGLLNTIKSWVKKGDFKAEEFEWSGLEDWLKAKGQERITKAELIEFLEGNGFQVEEVVNEQSGGNYPEHLTWTQVSEDKYEAVDPRSESTKYTITRYDDGKGNNPWVLAINGFRDGEWHSETIEIENSLEWLKSEADADYYHDLTFVNRPDNTRYSKYIEPGGENYRELLITLPEKRIPVDRSAYMGEGMTVSDPNTYRSGHWDEPNVLAHVRFIERLDENGNRIIYIEEIQSDWHQEGRKKGYKGPDTKEGWTAERIGDTEYWEVKDDSGRTVGYEISALDEKEAIANTEIIKKGQSVPDAPFKQTWTTLALKRMIRWAAENDFDRVAWTSGIVQAERYNLGKYLNKIGYAVSYDESENLVYTYYAYGKSDEVVLSKTKQTEEQLEEQVGKEVAQRIINGEGKINEETGTKELTGLDLEVGGEGMKGFYDQMLPSAANKFIKKWGAKASKTTIDNIPSWAFEVTDKMRESALGGMPLFQAAKGPWNVSVKKGYAARKKIDHSVRKSQDFQKAKRGDVDAADRIIEKLWTEKDTEKLKGLLSNLKNTVLVSTPSSSRLNILPYRLTKFISEKIGVEFVDGGELFESGHGEEQKNIPPEERYLKPPEFEPTDEAVIQELLAGRNIVVVDDIFSTGGSVFDLARRLEALGLNIEAVAGLMGDTRLRVEKNLVNKLRKVLKNANLNFKAQDLSEGLPRRQVIGIIDRINEEGRKNDQDSKRQLAQDLQGILDRLSSGPLRGFPGREGRGSLDERGTPGHGRPSEGLQTDSGLSGRKGPSLQDEELEQPSQDDTPTPRASVNITPDGQAFINLFARADASSVLHEAAHIWRRDLEDAALMEGAAPQVMADWQTIQAWVGAEPGAAWTVEQEETFARGMEAYFMEGYAPSLELKPVFRRFKKWLLDVYKSVRNLDVNLNDDVRGVFDRMLATEEEITVAKAAQDLDEPFFPPGSELSPEEQAEYDAAFQRAQQSVEDAVEQKRLREIKDLTPGWKKRAKQIADENPVHRIMDDIVSRGGLNLDALKRDYDADTVAALRKKRVGVATRAGQVFLDEVADEYNLDGDELMNQLLDVPTKTQIIQNWVDRQAADHEALMDEGDYLTDAREELLALEVDLLARHMPEDHRHKPYEARGLKKVIRQKTGQTKVTRLVPEYEALKASMRSHARGAREGLREGRRAEALKWKQKQLETAVKTREYNQRRRFLENTKGSILISVPAFIEVRIVGSPPAGALFTWAKLAAFEACFG